MRAFVFEVRHAIRTLRRNPGFTLGATIVLALGVGANTSIFNVARALVFQTLPFHAPERLVAVWKERVQTGARQGASWPDLADWEAQKDVFHGVAAYMESTEYALSSGGDGSAEPITDIHVTQDFFPVLGVRPAIGRQFSSGEFAEQRAIVSEEPAIVSHAFWAQRMGARTDALDQVITIGAVRHFVVGVLPPDFQLFRRSTPEVFSPLRAFPGHSLERRMAYLTVVARLKADVPISGARAKMSAYSRRAATEHPQTEAGLRCNLEPLGEYWFGPLRPLMILLLGTVAVVLCIACANVAFLFLIRAMRREREIALRMALGAGRARVCRQLMIEALVLALAGGIVGFVAAVWAQGLFTAFSSAADMRLPPMRFDGAVIAFTILVSLATAALFGLVPAWRAANLDLYSHLRGGGTSLSRGFVSHFGRAAVLGEIAMSTLLLAGAAALLKGFILTNSTHPGFRAEHALTVSIGQVPLRESFQQREDYFWSQLLDRTNSLPGIRAAAICRAFPLSEDAPPAKMTTRIKPEGRPSRDSEGLAAEFQDVSPGYFRALGIPLLNGRAFDARDARKDKLGAYQPVVVINRALARELWGSEDPVGKRILSGGALYTIVGVSADVKQHKLWRTPMESVVYRPLWLSDLFKMSSRYLVVRTLEDPDRMSATLKALVRSIDAERPVLSVRTMEEVILQSAAWERLRLSVVGLFGAAALILTIAGVYAVVSYSVALKQREIGIRIALGGWPGGIQARVLWQIAVLAGAGASIGVVAAWLLSRMLGARLYGVGALDAGTLSAVWLAVAGATLVACYFPARKATHVDPSISLRME